MICFEMILLKLNDTSVYVYVCVFALLFLLFADFIELSIILFCCDIYFECIFRHLNMIWHSWVVFNEVKRNSAIWIDANVNKKTCFRRNSLWKGADWREKLAALMRLCNRNPCTLKTFLIYSIAMKAKIISMLSN